MKQAIERIDWEEDFLLPEVEALKSGKPVLGLPAGSAFDIQIELEQHEVPATNHTNSGN